MITACPMCESADINERTHWEPKYRCMGCGDTFEEPIERCDRRSGPSTTSHGPIGKALLDADPDDVGQSLEELRS